MLTMNFGPEAEHIFDVVSHFSWESWIQDLYHCSMKPRHETAGPFLNYNRSKNQTRMNKYKSQNIFFGTTLQTHNTKQDIKQS